MHTLKRLPPDTILGLTKRFNMDTRAHKLNLGVGELIRDNILYKFNVVKKAEKLIEEEDIIHRYLPIEGNTRFLEHHCKVVIPERKGWDDLLKYQTVAGTGALALSRNILLKMGVKQLVLPNVTWANHRNIFNGIDIDVYPYFENGGLVDHQKIVNHIKKSSIDSEWYLLQASCFNPCGVNYHDTELLNICFALKESNKSVLVDNAYQGLGSGCYKRDAQMIMLLDQMKIPYMVASSCSKNIGLYGQRLGSLIVSVSKNDNEREILDSNIKTMIRGMYSSPPMYGSLIAEKIFDQGGELFEEWCQECAALADHMKRTRELLDYHLKEEGVHWNGLLDSEGLFYLSPITAEQSETLINDHAIYTLASGRVNIAGLSSLKQIEMFVKAVKSL